MTPGAEETLLSIAELEERLRIAEDTLRAIRSGEVDALVVSGPGGDRVFTLQGADHPYRMLVEQMQEGTVTLDPQGIILYANPRFAAMVNSSVDALLGIPMASFIAAEQAQTFAALLADSRDRGRAELILRTPAGASIPVQISTSGVELDGANLRCAVITDLTERRRSESIIQDERLSRLILNQAAEAIIVIDPAGRILRASESAERLAGQNPLFKPFDSALPLLRMAPRDAQLGSTAILDSIRRGESLRGVEVRCARGARVSELLLSAGPVWDDNHELLACVLTLTDFTLIKEAERELERRKRELEQSNNELQQFAYSASHDLREPLRIVTVYSQLLQKKYADQLDSQAQEYIGRSIEAAMRMEKLLRDLLEYMQAGDAPRALQSAVDANSVLRKVLTSLNTIVVEAGATVTQDPLPVVRIYEAHLQQLLQNLVSNAIKYRAQAPCRVHVSAEREDAMWKFSVHDNGIGIAPQYHQQVFGLFKRLHGGAQYRGSGIGLAICQKIVERYGGRIWVESQDGCGSTFHFTLPAEFV